MFLYFLLFGLACLAAVFCLVCQCIWGDRQEPDANGQIRIYNPGIEFLASVRTNNNWWPLLTLVIPTFFWGAFLVSGFGSPPITTTVREAYDWSYQQAQPLGQSSRFKRTVLAVVSGGNTELEELQTDTQQKNWVEQLAPKPIPIVYRTWFWFKAALLTSFLWLMLSPLCLVDELVMAAKEATKRQTAKGKAKGSSGEAGTSSGGYNMTWDWIGDFGSAFFGYWLSSLSRR